MTSGGVIEFGLAESLAKPGGNVTGLTVLASDLSGKRVELLKEAFPKSRRVATLWSRVSLGFKETQDAAKALSVPLYPIECARPMTSTRHSGRCRRLMLMPFWWY